MSRRLQACGFGSRRSVEARWSTGSVLRLFLGKLHGFEEDRVGMSAELVAGG